MATRPIADGPPGWLKEIAASVALMFVGALAVMFGMAHAHRIWPGVPALGYWDSFFLLLWVDITINAVLFGVRIKLLED